MLILLLDTDSDEITELPVAMCYNLALCAFLFKKFRSAERLLKLVSNILPSFFERNLLTSFFYQGYISSEILTFSSFLQVHSSLSNIVASLPSSPCHETLSLKFNHVIPLLIDVSLILNKPNAALSFLSEADALAKTLSQER